jgi:hypothetical protein
VELLMKKLAVLGSTLAVQICARNKHIGTQRVDQIESQCATG